MKTIHTIRLGENAFDEYQEDFSPIDTNDEKKYLQEKGEINGSKNSPDSQALTPDAVEQEIIQKIAQTVQRTRAGLKQHFDGFYERLLPMIETWDPTALIDKIQTIPSGTENSLNDMFRTFETESAIKGPEWRDAQKDYDKFREQRNLTRLPDYFSIKAMVLWFTAIILTEAILNATLLGELKGFLWALGQTILITSVNVMICASWFGLFLRYKNHDSRKIRWLSWISAPAIVVVLVFNVGVGHYRDAQVEEKVRLENLQKDNLWDDNGSANAPIAIIDYTKQAMESFLDSPISIDSVLSVLLIIVGIGFFGFAANKWYSMLDPCPGYRKRDIVLKKTHKNYKNLVEKTRANMSRKIIDTEKKLSDERTKIVNIHTQYNELINRSQTLKDNYANWTVVLGKTQDYLLTLYRDSNRQNRSDSAPSHFEHTITIDESLTESPGFDEPNLGDVKTVVDEIKLAERKVKETADRIWLQFNQLADMQSGPREKIKE